jgi:hypothetical protein
MSIEAMKQALEALEVAANGGGVNFYEYAKDLRQAIAEAEKQEPDKYAMDIECTKCGAQQSGILTVKTTLQQRTWVGLTDEEIQEIALELPMDAVRITEAKLKEKNT